MEKSTDLQPKNSKGQFKRTSGIRSLEEGLLTDKERVRISELRSLLRDQSFRDEVLENLTARTIMLDGYMTAEFLIRFSKALNGDKTVDIDGLFGRLSASAGHITRLIREIERRESEGIITINDLVEGESREVEEDEEETDPETDQD